MICGSLFPIFSFPLKKNGYSKDVKGVAGSAMDRIAYFVIYCNMILHKLLHKNWERPTGRSLVLF
jgi:hypothetical protein